jgi:hypothetical protein
VKWLLSPSRRWWRGRLWGEVRKQVCVCAVGGGGYVAWAWGAFFPLSDYARYFGDGGGGTHRCGTHCARAGGTLCAFFCAWDGAHCSGFYVGLSR